ncbi:hypothetical protein [Paraflavitalea sp. CAU 1676]|uniref:hypothetical protein n=1 Tax=Paraflavitalea sp. CAU 1676 TaxID=3032598 RepID=UPI0023DB6CE7|nr:hypothetical protein [Paraflavitalea sp. CAU 1676]MDF2193749.1 hypothetical protein [Paraflavitalea sp. CAU 1676]
MLKTVTLKPGEISQYLDYFEELAETAVPARARQYFESGEYKQLDQQEITNLLDGYPFDEGAPLEIDIAKLSMLLDYSNDGYYDEGVFFLPLATLSDQNAYIGIQAGDDNHTIYYFEPQDGFTEQDFTLDELFKKLK